MSVGLTAPHHGADCWVKVGKKRFNSWRRTIDVHICVCMFVRLLVFMHVCMFVRTYVCMYVRMHVWQKTW
jgi:hypothetical protein